MPISCIICDIDGTLADLRHRLHHLQTRDWDAFFADMGADTPIEPVRRLLVSLWEDVHITTILCSGRPENYRSETESWLEKHEVKYERLYMRPAGDKRQDHIVKREILDQVRADNYDPWLVIDDRDSVVEMWRNNGLYCLQAAIVESKKVPTATLTLMVGPSGAGKGYWLKSLEAKQRFGIYRHHIISSDHIRADLFGDFREQSQNQRVFEVLHELVKVRLRNDLPTVIDATNLHKKDRMAAAALACGGPVRYIVIDRAEGDKRQTAGWRGKLDIDLIGKHAKTFKSQLPDILSGDGLPNVTVHDLREKK